MVIKVSIASVAQLFDFDPEATTIRCLLVITVEMNEQIVTGVVKEVIFLQFMLFAHRLSVKSTESRVIRHLQIVPRAVVGQIFFLIWCLNVKMVENQF